MNGIMIDDLLEPLNDAISKNTLSKIPKKRIKEQSNSGLLRGDVEKMENSLAWSLSE